MDLFVNMLMLIPGGYEWILIILIIIIVIFGAKKIPQLARSFGKATSEFEKARIESKNELEKIKNEDRLSREKLESIADTLRIDYDGKDDESLKKDIDAAIKRGKEYDL
jgi:sec-independent protein translocase protein TatA